MRQFRDEAIHRKLLLPLSGGTKVKGRRPHQTPGTVGFSRNEPRSLIWQRELWESRAAATYVLVLFCLGILQTSSAVWRHSRVEDGQTEDPLTQDQSCVYGRFSKTLIYCNL